MNKLIKISFIAIFVMLFLVFSCFPKKSSRELKNSREISTYKYIIGGTEGNTINFLFIINFPP